MFSSPDYRYGYNTQESDIEKTDIWGTHTTAEYWMYDTRVGRKWNVDPIPVPWESVYAVNRNNPIALTDPNGAFPGKGGPKKKRKWNDKKQQHTYFIGLTGMGILIIKSLFYSL